MLTLYLSTATDLPGRIVSLVEASAIVHVALDLGLPCAIAASEQPGGLWLVPSAQYASARRWPLPVTIEQEVTIRDWLWQRVGSAYDYAAVMVDGVRLLTHVQVPLPQEHAWDCSGVIAQACAAASYLPFGIRDPRLVTPADWAQIAQQ